MPYFLTGLCLSTFCLRLIYMFACTKSPIDLSLLYSDPFHGHVMIHAVYFLLGI